MAVITADIAVELGRPTPDDGSIEALQWAKWIADAQFLIRSRLGDLDALDQTALDYVVTLAVAAHVRRPDDSTQVDVAVDDARVSRRYASGKGRVVILDEWWDLLSPAGSNAGAFAIDTVPAGVGGGHSDICALYFGGAYCSCGAVLTNLVYPLYEGGALS